MPRIKRFTYAFPLALLATSLTGAQTATAPVAPVPVTGTITDASGALIPNATLSLTPHVDGAHADAIPSFTETHTDGLGHFSVSLPPGLYDLTVEAEGFDSLKRTVTLGPSSAALKLQLSVAAIATEINVPSNAAASTANADNKSALVFKGDQLDALSDDDTTLQHQMLAMAGGSGEGGGKIYVDGFSGGAFPPKDTIREVRINQNPYSAQFEDLGLGRIEVFTKPGTGTYHGSFFVDGSDKPFNALNPYTGAEPPYFLLFARGDLSGPLGKKTSFLVSGRRFDMNNNSVVNAFNPDGSRLSLAVPTPVTETTPTLRLDRQISKNNTGTIRYEYDETDSKNTGVGLLVLPSQGTTNTTNVQTLQIGNTAVIGANVVAESRFQYLRTRLNQTPNSTAPTLVVQGAFEGGGSPTQANHDSSDNFEFQQYFSVSQGNHFLRLGARYRLLHETNTSTANFNGQFTFTSLASYTAGTPSLFNLTAGQTTATLLTGDLGAYAEDEWKAAKNITVTVGLRLESQSAIPDHLDPAPRAGISWAVRQTDKHPALFVLRANAGIFYSRFAPGNILTSIRQNGTSQLAFLLSNPTFYPNVPDPAQLSGTAPTPYRLNPHLRVASENIASVEVERSLGKIGSVTASYYAVRGVHQYNSFNINAPLASGVRPLGGSNDIYQFASEGVEKAQSISLNSNLQLTKRFSVFVYYTARRQNNDTFGATSFPSQPYNVSADYGPSGLGMQPVGQTFFADGDFKLPFGFAVDAFAGIFSRSRFNITTGIDRNNDTQFDDRPAFATAPTAASVIYRTPYGTFDANPQPGEAIVPYNFGLAPRLVFMQSRILREWKFGPRPPAPPPPALKPGQPAPKPAPRPDPKYSLRFVLESVNTLNSTNPAPPVGVLFSPFFGHSLSTNNLFGLTQAANRVLFLGTSFRF